MLGFGALYHLNFDAWVLFATRCLRLWAFGSTGVILAVYLSALGLPDERIGSLLSATLFGDAAISLVLTFTADMLGRRACLLLGCALQVLGAVVFVLVRGPDFVWLLVGATIGVISPSGNEVGPFMALEQSILSDLVPPSERTSLFAWYNLLGHVSTASGSLAAGAWMVYATDSLDMPAMEAYRTLFMQYGGVAVAMAVLVCLLTARVEAAAWQAARAPACPAGFTAKRVSMASAAGSEAGGVVVVAASRGAAVTATAAGQDDLTAPLLMDEEEGVMQEERVRDDEGVTDEERVREEQAGNDGVVRQGSSLAGQADSLLRESLAGESEDGMSDAVMVAVHLPVPPSALQPAPASQQPVPSLQPAAVMRAKFGLSPPSRRIVARLAALFSIDSFAAGCITGSLMAYYFHERFDASDAWLGRLLFGANTIAGLSSLAAGWVAHHFGLINTMVFTHLPSNFLLASIPLAPSLNSAAALVFARFSISQMDVAPRQSYVSGVVPAADRTAAIGITNIVRSLGAAAGPLVTGYLAQHSLWPYAFFLAGGLKIVYDLLLLASFRSLRAEHEVQVLPQRSAAQK